MDYKDARALLQKYLDQELTAFDGYFAKHGPMPADKRWTLEKGIGKHRTLASLGCSAIRAGSLAAGLRLLAFSIDECESHRNNHFATFRAQFALGGSSPGEPTPLSPPVFR